MRLKLLAAALFALTAGPALADDVTIETATGPATVAAKPETIAVFDMAALDMLDALGVEGIVSTQKTFVDKLKTYEGDIGTLFEPDFEVLNAREPDLIIAGGRSASQVEALSGIAPTIDMTINGADLLSDARARLTAYGELFGKQDEAAELIATLDAELDATKQAVKDRGTGLMLLTNGGKISAYGPGGRFGWLYTELGLPAAVEGLEDTSHGESVSFEFIREANPDWILVLDRVAAIAGEGESAEATLANPLVAETSAARKGQIVHLNSGEIYIAGGGIQSTLATLKIVKNAFDRTN